MEKVKSVETAKPLRLSQIQIANLSISQKPKSLSFTRNKLIINLLRNRAKRNIFFIRNNANLPSNPPKNNPIIHCMEWTNTPATIVTTRTKIKPLDESPDLTQIPTIATQCLLIWEEKILDNPRFQLFSPNK